MRTFSFSTPRVDEVYSWTISVYNVVKDLKPEDLILTEYKSRVKMRMSKLDQAHLKLSSKVATQILRDKDKVRDKIFKGFRSYCKAYSQCLEPKKEEAAELLLDAIRLHGWTVYSESDAKESSRLEKLVNDLTKEDKLVAAVAAIKGESWVSKIEAANNDFISTSAGRSESEAKKMHKQTKVELQLLKTDMDYLFKYMDAMAGLNADSSWKEACDKIDELTNNMLATVKSRKTRKRKNDDKENNDTEQ